VPYDHADEGERLIGVGITIYGFDAASGLPRSDDPRDLLYCWPAGSFEMDIARLRERIGSRATLLVLPLENPPTGEPSLIEAQTERRLPQT
jgi:hypothetical protein